MPECSKCHAALNTTGYPLWCQACRTKHKRDYEEARKEMRESRGYAAGISAMRDHLAKNFSVYGTAGAFNGAEIAHIIMTCKPPA